MDLISSIIELYFTLVDSIDLRTVSVLIIVVIIGIEFLEFFTDAEAEEADPGRRRQGKMRGGAYFKRLFGLEGKGRSVRGGLDRAGPAPAQPGAPAPERGAAQGHPAGLDEALPPAAGGAQVIGSKTYTVRTILDGNYVYLEEVEERPPA